MRAKKGATWALLGALAVAGSLGVVACGGDDDSGDSSSTPDSGTATKGGIYRVGTSDLGFNDGFDPSGEYLGWAWGIQKQLLIRGLTGFRYTKGAAGTEVQPDLATELPEPSDDGLTWTFTVKKGVKFGPPVNREVTSKDIAYAIQRIATPSVGAQYAGYYRVIKGFNEFSEGKAKTISGIATPDDQTITFTLTKPTPDFLYRLSLPAAAAIPEEVAKCHTGAGEYGRYLIASGPYMIKGSDTLDITSCESQKPISGFRPTGGLSLVRNPNYDPATDTTEQREALPDGFEFIVNTNTKDIFDKIEAGEYEGNVDAVPADVASRYSRDDALKDRLQSNVDDGVNMVVMTMNEAPFDDINVRRAVNYVMDKQGLQRAWGGPFYGELAGHIIPNTMFADDPEIVDYDPFATPDSAGDVEAAKNEMKKSKYDTNQDGVCDAGACKGVLFLNRNVVPFNKLSPIIRDSLSKIGITVEVRELPTGPAYETSNSLRQRVPIYANARWGKDYSDPSTYGVLFDGRNIIANGNSVWGLTGLTAEQAKEFGIPYPEGGVPNVDADIDACNAASGDERRSCWIAFDKKVTSEVVPWVPYMFSKNTDVLGPAVAKWDFDQFSGEAAYAHVAVDTSKQK